MSAKLAADEPDSHDVGWFVPSPTSYASSLKRSGRMPAGGPRLSSSGQEQQVPAQRQTEAGPDCGSGQQEARLEVLPADDGALPHRPVPPVDDENAGHQVLVVPVQDPDPRTSLQELPAVEEPAEKDQRAPVRTRDRTKIAELLAYERSSKVILDFLSTGGSGGREAVRSERGRTGNARSTSHRWRRKRQCWEGWNRRLICFLCLRGALSYFSFPMSGISGGQPAGASA